MMKLARLICLVCIVWGPAAYSEEINTVGTVILFEGTAVLSSFVSGEKFTIDESTRIRIGHKITTGKATVLDIALDDGSVISLRESTSVYFFYLRKEKNDPPTKFKIDFGKIRMNQKNNYPDKTVEIITPACEISAVTGDFSVVAADSATAVLVHGGRIGLASSNPKVREAYVGTEGEEILVARDWHPVVLGTVPRKRRDRWLSGLVVVDKYRRIVRMKDGGEVVDSITREALW